MNIAEIDMYRILDNKAGLIVWTLFPTTGIILTEIYGLEAKLYFKTVNFCAFAPAGPD